MSKLTFEALEQRAEAVVTEKILSTISGGTEDSCHDDPPCPDGDSDCLFEHGSPPVARPPKIPIEH